MAELAQGAWEDAEAMVGQVLATQHGPDPVAESDFRRHLEVLGLDCPLHTDAGYARARGYRAIPAPVAMTRIWAVPAYWSANQPRPGDEAMALMIAGAHVPGVGDTVLATHLRLEHHEPLYPGDRVTATAVLVSVTRKTTRVGAGAFLVVETTFANQHGRTVTVETSTLFRFQPTAAP